MINRDEIKFMKSALKLALKGREKVSPNPLVGAVVVKGGKIIGRGWHKKGGGPHAEVFALTQAIQKTKGAMKGTEMFVTLEPCCHFGKTPPCVDAIIEAGIKKVFVAMKDPNPLVCGKGISKLRKKGVKVFSFAEASFFTKVTEDGSGAKKVGGYVSEARKMGAEIADAATRINEVFIKYVKTGMPFVSLKVASSLDGRIATQSGDSKWITNAKARGFAHELRFAADAVLVGKNTVMKDDPRLTARKNGKIIKRPYRIVLGGEMDLPLSRKIFQMKDGRTIVAVSKVVAKGIGPKKKKKLKLLGVKIIEVAAEKNGRISLKSLLGKLGKMGITSVLVEGGSETLTSFIKAGVVDKFYYTIAPIIVGGGGIPSVGELGVKKIRESISLKKVEVKKFDDNILLIGYP